MHSMEQIVASVIFLVVLSVLLLWRKKKQKQQIRLQSSGLASTLSSLLDSLPLSRNTLEQYLSGHKYFSHTDWERLQECRQILLQTLRNHPLADYEAIEQPPAQFLLRFALAVKSGLGNREDYNRKAEDFLLSHWEKFFDQCESNPLTQAQRRACINDDDNTLVVAGAGSGKTSTIISKCLYLIQSGLALPEQILLLAYNRNAADEIKERIKRKIGSTKLDVHTFHSFGNKILNQHNDNNLRLTNFVEQDVEFSRFIVSTVQEAAEKNPAYKKTLIRFFQEHQIPVYAESDFSDADLFNAFRNSLDLRTFRNELVKSGGELYIANLLYRWQIPYAYEARYPHITNASYKPDFLITDQPFAQSETNPLYSERSFRTIRSGARVAWIEYFGIDRNGNLAPFINREEYLKSRQWKRDLHQANATSLIELTTGDLQDGLLEEKLRHALCELGFEINPMSDEEFLHNLWTENRPLHPKWQEFISLIRNFLVLFKDSGYSDEEILARARQFHYDAVRIDAFLTLFRPVITRYEEFKRHHYEIDFSDMVLRSCEILDRQQERLPYRYVLVDEFQDVSRSRSLLLNSVLRNASSARLFAVGDDWQSIYRFSGSDLDLFVHFDRHYPKCSILQLDKTYRFSNKLNSLSSGFICKNPEQFKKHMTAVKLVDKPSALAVDVRKLMLKMSSQSFELKSALDSTLCYRNALYWCLHRISEKHKELDSQPPTVLLLGRMMWKNMPSLSKITEAELRKSFPLLSISYRTIHSAKGLEADYVLLIGIDSGVFPCTKQSDQIIESVLPMVESYPYAEERRLFYVGMTRPKKHLIILYDSVKPSPFMSELTRESPPDLLSQYSDASYEISCPRCKDGNLILHASRSGGRYYQCSNGLCSEVFSRCPNCGAPLIKDHTGRYCLNSQCNYIEIRCNKCASGFMKRRINSRNGHMFYGCSNWNSLGSGCSQTMQCEMAQKAINNYKGNIQKKRLDLSERFPQSGSQSNNPPC